MCRISVVEFRGVYVVYNIVCSVCIKNSVCSVCSVSGVLFFHNCV